jgi:uncharacterized protein YjbI with pentapeptide repeats
MSKIKIQIKNRWTGSIIFEYKKENNTLAETIKEYITQSQFRVDLTGVDLTGVDLTDVDLTGANLTRAILTRAILTDVDLTGAILTDAILTDAILTGVDLTGANLTGVDLTGVDLTGAILTRANLTGAILTGVDLTRAILTDIKNDMFIVLLHAIPEIKFLKQNIIEGKIHGSTYEGECACLSGTLKNGSKKSNGNLEKIVSDNIMSCRNSSRPIERFFLAIKIGDTPETSQFSKLALKWIEEFERLLNIK